MKIAFIVVYLVVAIAMIAFIMLQRGSGAAAGSGFGSGASGTVFGARGSANFLSKATKWLAVVFFLITLFMAWNATRRVAPGPVQQDLGVMSQQPAPAQAPAGDGGMLLQPKQFLHTDRQHRLVAVVADRMALACRRLEMCGSETG